MVESCDNYNNNNFDDKYYQWYYNNWKMWIDFRITIITSMSSSTFGRHFIKVLRIKNLIKVSMLQQQIIIAFIYLKYLSRYYYR